MQIPESRSLTVVRGKLVARQQNAVPCQIQVLEVTDSGRLSCATRISMVEPANFGQFYHPAELRRLNRPWDRCILFERQVSACSLVVFEIRFQDSAQAGFIHDDHLVQPLPPDRSSQSGSIRAASSVRATRRGIANAVILTGVSFLGEADGQRVLIVDYSQRALLAASKASARNAPCGASSCLKYAKTSPRWPRSATISIRSRRLLGEYLSFRRRR